MDNSQGGGGFGFGGSNQSPNDGDQDPNAQHISNSLGKWLKLKGRGDSSPPPFVNHFSIRKSMKKGRVLEGGDESPLHLNSGHIS